MPIADHESVGADLKRRIRDWLFTSALTAVWLTALWAVKTLWLAQFDDTEENHAVSPLKLASLDLVDSVLDGHNERKESYFRIVHSLRALPRVSRAERAEFIDSLTTFQSGALHDSAALANISLHALDDNDRALITFFTTLSHLESGYWAGLRTSIGRGNGPWKENWEQPEDWGPYVTALFASRRTLHLYRLVDSIGRADIKTHSIGRQRTQRMAAGTLIGCLFLIGALSWYSRVRKPPLIHSLGS